MARETHHGYVRGCSRNVRPAPLAMTPQVVRGALGIGHPARVFDVPVLGQLADQVRGDAALSVRADNQIDLACLAAPVDETPPPGSSLSDDVRGVETHQGDAAVGAPAGRTEVTREVGDHGNAFPPECMASARVVAAVLPVVATRNITDEAPLTRRRAEIAAAIDWLGERRVKVRVGASPKGRVYYPNARLRPVYDGGLLKIAARLGFERGDL